MHTFVKIKSHRTLQEATADDELGALLRWHGNRAADRFAKMGASTHASPEGRKLAHEYEEKVIELAALARWIGRALAQWPRAPTGSRPATRRRRGELAAARRTTRTRAASRYGHHLAMGRDGWHCTTCGKTAATLGGARKLTAERCQGHTANRVGPQGSAPSAHVLWAAEAERSQTGYLAPDVIWCARCGAYSSTKVYKLGHACPGTLEKSARTRLAAFSCRRHPITRHLLAPPIRLTDAVLAALASGAARRREAFNLLLRGDPCADARPQAEVAANLDHAAIDFNPTPVIIAAPEEEEDPYDGQPVHKRARTSAIGHQFAGGVGFAAPEDEFDIDIFGHGFDMNGTTHNPAATVDGTADSSRARPLSVYAGAASSTTTSSQVPSPPAGADGATSGSTPLGGDWKQRRFGCEDSGVNPPLIRRRITGKRHADASGSASTPTQVPVIVERRATRRRCDVTRTPSIVDAASAAHDASEVRHPLAVAQPESTKRDLNSPATSDAAAADPAEDGQFFKRRRIRGPQSPSTAASAGAMHATSGPAPSFVVGQPEASRSPPALP